MKLLFVGEMSGNTGPANVNRELISNWPNEDEISCIKSSNKLMQIIEGMRKGIHCDVLIFSNNSMVDVMLHLFFYIMHKPCVCFNHGYAPMENDINKGNVPNYRMHAIKKHMAAADALVANSELQMHLLENQIPHYSGLLTYINLGVNYFQQMTTVRNNTHPILAVSGGTRLIKANEVVVRAIDLLKERGIDCELRVYGRDYASNDELSNAIAAGDVIFKGQIAEEDFIMELSEADVFVMNSRHESFGLSALDALRAGCSLLLSKNCGVGGVLALEENDVVLNSEDALEIADKIMSLLECSNSERLYRSLNFDDLCWSKVASRLRSVCSRVIS